jgi:Protein of unknown function (DUF2723)
MKRLAKIIIPGLIGLFLGGLYLYTLAPGLTWAYDGADGGDLLTAAITGGIPHPSGYPTYLLLASLFLKIPFGSLAYRTNLLSCVCTVSAALVIYKIVRAMQPGFFPAAIAALVFGTFPLVWSQAILTEVNALNGLFAALLLYLFILSGPSPWLDWLGGIILGLALGNHLSILFILPLVFFDKPPLQVFSFKRWFQKETLLLYGKLVGRRLAGLLLGLGVYLLIPIRARAEAPVNWGNAVTWDRLVWLATGKMYWGRLDYFNGSYLLAGVEAWSHFLVQQLGIFGLLLLFIVLAELFRPSRVYVATSWLVMVYSSFSILYYSPDSYVYLIPALIAFSIWIGLGSGWVAEQVALKYPFLEPLAKFGILAFLVIRAMLMIPIMSLSADQKAEDYARAILASAPARALIITHGDEATFSLWYFHFAYRERPDVVVVSEDLLVQPWYHEILRYTYPDLVVPTEPWIWSLASANSKRPVCHTRSDLQPRVDCSGS